MLRRLLFSLALAVPALPGMAEAQHDGLPVRRDSVLAALRTLGIAWFDAGGMAAATTILEKGWEIARATRSPEDVQLQRALGHVLVQRGTHQKSDLLDPALMHLRTALAAARGRRDSAIESAVLNDIGLAHYWKAVLLGATTWDSALAAYRAALAIGERRADTAVMIDAIFRSGLALQYGAGKRDEATAAFARSYALADAFGDPRRMAGTLRHVADMAEGRGAIDSAESYHREVLRLNERAGYAIGRSSTLATLGDLAIRTRADTAVAADYYARSLALADSIGARRLASGSRARLARLALARGDVKAASDMLERAIEDAIPIGDREALAELRAELARARGRS